MLYNSINNSEDKIHPPSNLNYMNRSYKTHSALLSKKQMGPNSKKARDKNHLTFSPNMISAIHPSR